MKLFKVIEIDLNKERVRIAKVYNKREQRALNKLIDLFEVGDWKGCLAHVCDPKAFPYNKKGGAPRLNISSCSMEIADILHNLSYGFEYHTEDSLKSEIIAEYVGDQSE
jgi:hypothetical protein